MIDVTGWEIVGSNSGTRQGYWIINQNRKRALVKLPSVSRVPRQRIRTLRLPNGDTVTDDEFERYEVWAKYLAMLVGRRLGLPVPEVLPVYYRGRHACLAWDFCPPLYQLKEGVDLFEPAQEEKATLSLSRVRGTLATYLGEEGVRLLTHMVCFDILIGNRDRHHRNWGILRPNGVDAPTLMAPFYDNSAGFGSGIMDEDCRKGISGDWRRFDREFEYEITVSDGRKARIADLLPILGSWSSNLFGFVDLLERLDRATVHDLVYNGAYPEISSDDHRAFATKMIMHRQDLILGRVSCI